MRNSDYNSHLFCRTKFDKCLPNRRVGTINSTNQDKGALFGQAVP